MLKKFFAVMVGLFGYHLIKEGDNANASVPKEKDIIDLLNETQPEPVTKINFVDNIADELKFVLGDKSLPRGIRNNNAGNLVQTNIPWQGKIDLSENTDSRFEQFQDPVYGLRAMYKDIINDIKRGANTLDKLITQYAPKFENNTQAYINFVAKETGLNPNEEIPLNADVIVKLGKAIVVKENGANPLNKYWYSDNTYKEAYRKAV